jgi:hypothetical protein
MLVSPKQSCLEQRKRSLKNTPCEFNPKLMIVYLREKMPRDFTAVNFVPVVRHGQHVCVPILGALYLVPIIGTMRKSIHTPEYAALRAHLHKLRGDAGLSQRELAARLRVPHSWVAKVESGERRIDLVEFCWFAEACDADADSEFRRIVRLTEIANKHRSGNAKRSLRS